MTIYKPKPELEKTIAAFCNNGGAGKPIHVKLTFSYARHYKQACVEAFDQWRSNCIDTDKLALLKNTEEFDAAAESISLEKILSTIPVSDSTDFFSDLINETFALGVDTLILHNVNRDQSEFINDFSSNVFSKLQKLSSDMIHSETV